MQISKETDVAGVLDRLVADALPGRRGLEAWRSLLRAHATLIRQLGTDLENETGQSLADFDVLARLAHAGGELRMTELADRAFISRSAMTRRVARLVRRRSRRSREAPIPTHVASWSRSTDAGVTWLTETTPVHMRGIFELFVADSMIRSSPVLEKALDKVTIDCTFG